MIQIIIIPNSDRDEYPVAEDDADHQQRRSPAPAGGQRAESYNEDTDTQKYVSLSMKSTEGGHPLISTIATKQSPLHMKHWLCSSPYSFITSVIHSLFTGMIMHI